MPVDTSIPLNIKTPTVADLLNTAGAYQNFRSGQIDLAGKEAANKVNPNDYTNEQGQLDTTGYNKSMNDALYSAGAGSQAPQYQQQRMSAEVAAANARQAQFELHNTGLQQNQQDITNLLAKPDPNHSEMKATAEKMRSEGRLDPQHYQQFMDTLGDIPDDPASNKLLLTQILGNTLSVQQRLPQYEWRQSPDGSWQQWQANPNGIHPETGKQGVQPASSAIPSAAMTTYTDANNVQHVMPDMAYRAMVNGKLQGGQPGMQVGAAPGTQADIQQGTQQRGVNQKAALQSQQEIAPLKQARSIIDQHKDDSLIFGTGSDLGKRVGLLAATLGIPFTDIATTSAELKARGIDPSQNTYQSLKYNIDSAMGKHYEAMKKNEAMNAYIQNNGNSPENQRQFEDAWLKNANRNASIMMSKDDINEQRKFFRGLSKPEQQKIINHLSYIKNLGVNP